MPGCVWWTARLTHYTTLHCTDTALTLHCTALHCNTSLQHFTTIFYPDSSAPQILLQTGYRLYCTVLYCTVLYWFVHCLRPCGPGARGSIILSALHTALHTVRCTALQQYTPHSVHCSVRWPDGQTKEDLDYTPGMWQQQGQPSLKRLEVSRRLLRTTSPYSTTDN